MPNKSPTAPKKPRAPGGGRKPSDDVLPLTRKQVLLDYATDESSVAILTKVGNGELSLGIREAARRLVEHNDTSPFDFDRHKSRKKRQ